MSRVMRRRPSGPFQSTGRSRGRSTQGRADMMRRLAAQRSFANRANRSPSKPAQGNLPQGKSKLLKSTRTPAQIAETRSRFEKKMRDRRKLPTTGKLKKANVSPTTPRRPRKKTVTKRPNVDPRPPTRRRSLPKNVRGLRATIGAARRRRLI